MVDIAQLQVTSLNYQALQPVNTQPNQELSSQRQVDSKSKTESGIDLKVLPEQTTQEVVKPSDNSQMEQSLVTLNEQLNQLKNTLQFEKDQNSERMLILVKDRTSGETIRQIPSEEFLAISKNITNFLESVNKLDKNVSFPPGMLTSERA